MQEEEKKVEDFPSLREYTITREEKTNRFVFYV